MSGSSLQIWKKLLSKFGADFAQQAKLLTEDFAPSIRMTAGLVQVVAVFHCVREYVVDFVQCSGPSMLPTIKGEGDIVLIDRMTPWMQRIREGDIVTAGAPNNPYNVICKRVCGMAGDVVEVLPSNPKENIRLETVPPGHVWLQGDNLPFSTDSRTYGPVPIGLITGKVFCKVWPWQQATMFKTEPDCCRQRVASASS